MADKFPGPYRNSVPQDVDNADPMVKRVRFSATEIGARPSIIPKGIKNDMTVSHVPSSNSK